MAIVLSFVGQLHVLFIVSKYKLFTFVAYQMLCHCNQGQNTSHFCSDPEVRI